MYDNFSYKIYFFHCNKIFFFFSSQYNGNNLFESTSMPD